ncbi:MAG: helix-turn-helix domain-containing protein [Parvularculaceae bacterium]
MSRPHTSRKKSARDEAFWILDQKQLQCLASPVRQDILDRLASSGPMSARDLAEALSLNPTALYRHLEILQTAKLVLKTGARLRNRRTETLYAVPARRLLLEKAFENPRNASVLAKIMSAMTRQLDRDASRSLAAGTGVTSGPHRNLGFARRVGAPNAKDLATINLKLAEISAILRNGDQRSGDIISLGWVMAPGGGER